MNAMMAAASCFMHGKTYESSYDPQSGRSLIYNEERVERQTTAQPRVEYGGEIDDLFKIDIEVDKLN